MPAAARRGARGAARGARGARGTAGARGAAAAAAAGGSPLRVAIAGPPASGKGTQCETIIDTFQLVHVSAGDLLRAEVAGNTPNGVRAKGFMDAGKLVPNEVVVDIVKDRLEGDDARSAGWLLDGYPRSKEQADAITEAGIVPETFMLLEVPDDVLIDRVVGRRMDPETGKIYHLTFNPPPTEEVAERCTQRSDDTEEKARTRLEVYHTNIDAILDSYDGIIHRIDGNRAREAVFADIDSHIKGLRS